MAADMFLKITDVTGESLDDKHAGEIELLSWAWGVSNSGTTHAGPGGGGGKTNVQDMHFTKRIDTSTSALMTFCASGKHFAEANLTVRKSGDTPMEYFTIKFTDCMITSYQTGGGGDGLDRLIESLTLNFRKYDAEYTSQLKDGSPGKKFPAGYDMAANKKA